VEDSIVRRTSPERIQDFVINKIRETPEDEIPNTHDRLDIIGALVDGVANDFSAKRLRFIPELDLNFHKDRTDEAFFYFENCYVCVTAEGYEPRPYGDLDGKIWTEQVIDHEFEKIECTSELKDSDWFKFLYRAMGKDEDRFQALTSALGYLLHGYKDKALSKAIVFMDEVTSEGDEGRTGKSIAAESLGKLVPGERIDARNFTFDTRFAFQFIKPEYQYVDFNDASENFDFAKLFSLITDDMQVERKNQDPVTIPFEESPKFVITTNHVLKGEGASFEERVSQIEFAPYYGPDRKPKEDLGRRLYDDWGREQWSKFFNLMMTFVQQFLASGLHEYRHKNLKKRKLRQETSPDFAEWFLEVAKQAPEMHNKKTLHRSFLRYQLGVDPDTANLENSVPTQRQVTRWCNDAGKILTGEKLPTSKSGADRYMRIPSLDEIEQE
jgi:hypothetical protein